MNETITGAVISKWVIEELAGKLPCREMDNTNDSADQDCCGEKMLCSMND